jgi:mgtE-like transporter
MIKGVFDKDFKEILSSQLVSITGGIIAGVVLAAYTDKLLLIPGMLLALPAFLDMRGNISGSLSSRLSSGLFLGVINPKKWDSKIIHGNFHACFLLAVIISLFLGLLAFLFDYFVLKVFYPNIIMIFLLAGMIANMIEIPLTIFLTFYVFKKGHDPNNVLGPFVTSSGDVTSVLALLIALVII